jgi:hypothetical protein
MEVLGIVDFWLLGEEVLHAQRGGEVEKARRSMREELAGLMERGRSFGAIVAVVCLSSFGKLY